MVEFDTFAYVYYGVTVFVGFIIICYAWKACKKNREERLSKFKNRRDRKDIIL